MSSFKADTVMVTNDTDGTLMYVKREVLTDLQRRMTPVPRSGTLSTVASGTFQVFPVTRAQNGLVEDSRGKTVMSTHQLYGPLTSSISVIVGDRLYSSTVAVYYFDARRIDIYEDHIRVMSLRVEGR